LAVIPVKAGIQRDGNRPGLPGGKLLSFACPKESNQRRKAPSSAVLRTSLRCSISRVAAELGLRPQTVLAEFPRPLCAARRVSKGFCPRVTIPEFNNDRAGMVND